MLLSWSHPVLFLPSRLFLFNPLIPLLYADMAYQSIGKGVRRLNQLCSASGNLADSSCVSIGRGSARSISALLHTHHTFLCQVKKHHNHYCYKLFQKLYGIKSDKEREKPRSREQREMSSQALLQASNYQGAAKTGKRRLLGRARPPDKCTSRWDSQGT